MIRTSRRTENGDNRDTRKWERESQLRTVWENGIASPNYDADDAPTGNQSMASEKTDSESRGVRRGPYGFQSRERGTTWISMMFMMPIPLDE